MSIAVTNYNPLAEFERMNEVLCVQQANAILGEGPSWCSARQVLYWVDIERPAVFRYDPERGQTGRWPMPSTVGCAVPTKEGELLFADDDGFGILSLETGATRAVAAVEGHLPGNRFNDGKVDSRGRFGPAVLIASFVILPAAFIGWTPTTAFLGSKRG